MPVRRAVAVTALLAITVSGCGRLGPKTFAVRVVSPTTTTGTVGTMAANDEPIALAASVEQFLSDLAATNYLRLEAAVRERSTLTTRKPESVPAAASLDWDCVARVETGTDFTMHGPSYSSAYGVMDAAVRENASPPIAERILAGTAAPSEQLAVAQRIEREHGPHAWASATVARCGR